MRVPLKCVDRGLQFLKSLFLKDAFLVVDRPPFFPIWAFCSSAHMIWWLASPRGNSPREHKVEAFPRVTLYNFDNILIGYTAWLYSMSEGTL